MRMAWQTPIMTVNLASLGVDVPKFNSKLAAIVLHEYYKLQEQNPQLTKVYFPIENRPQRFMVPIKLFMIGKCKAVGMHLLLKLKSKSLWTSFKA